MDAKILIIEDEAGLVTALRDRLRKEGYEVSVAKDGLQGLELASQGNFELILLDLMLPGQSGLTVCQKLRQQGSNTPILMLTARRQTMDKVVGLRTGADDYLTKPFKMAELLARIDALLRRAGRPAEKKNGRYEFGNVQIDVRKTEVTREGQVVPLSAKVFSCCDISRSTRERRYPGKHCCTKCGDTTPHLPLGRWTCTWPGCGKSWNRIPRVRN